MQNHVCFFKKWLVQRVSLLGLVLFLTSTPLLAQYAPGVTVAGGNGSGNADNQLNGPDGVFVNRSGDVYAPSGDRVVKWAPGTSSGATVAGGNGIGGAANQFNIAYDVFVDRSGNIYVADPRNNRIQKWASGATSGVTVAGGNGGGPAANQLDFPRGVFVDGAGNIYIADLSNSRIQKWAPGASSGVTVAGGNGIGSAANQLSFPRGVFVDGAGNVYIADPNNDRIQKWAPGASSGVTVAGGNGIGSAANQFSSPSGVFVDESGNIYVADSNNHRIQKWAPGASSGVTVAGGNGMGSAANQLAYPGDVFVDRYGNIYVADTANDRIQKFEVLPISITSQPASASSVCVGSTVMVTVGVSPEPFAYQWYKDNQTTPLPGQTSATLSLTNVQLSDAGSYKAVITGSANSLTAKSFQLTVAPPPVSLSSSGNLSCANPSVTLTASSSSSVTYTFSAGAPQLGSSNTARVTQAGTYSVVVTSAGGCTATASVGVSGSSSPPTVALSASGPLSCANPRVTLTGSIINGASYVFSSGASQVGSGNTATVTQAGMYSVVVSSPGGCSSSATVSVSGSSTPPTINLAASGVISCANPTVNLIATAINGASYVFSAGTTPGSTTNIATVSQAGAYSVVVTDPNGCTALASINVTGSSTPPNVSLSTSGPLSCANPVVTLTASPIDGTTYVFSTGAISNNNTATVTQAGTYSVVVSLPGGCSSSATVNVSGNSTPPTIGLTTSGSISCANPVPTITATAISGASYVFGTGASQINGGNTATVSQAGTYSVVVTDPNGCKASASVTVSGTCMLASLSVAHWDADYNQLTNNVIRPYLQLTNTGTTPVPYGEITLRYWLTVEDFSPMTNLAVYWAQLGTDKVKMKYVELAGPRQGALGYVEYSFDASAGSLAPGANSGPIQSGIGKKNWTVFNESDDYSYANKTSFQPNSRITIYRNGQLVGGQEPASTVAVEQLRVYTQSTSSASTNTIGTYLQLRNEGNRPVSYGDVSVRYYFTADSSQPLNVYLDYAWLGNANIQTRFVKLTPPLANADTYLEVRFPAGLGQLYPLSGTGNIQYRIAKSDWSQFSQSNDHSYLANPSFAENSRVVVYVGNQRVYGQEPGAASARQAAAVSDASLRVVVLGNPVRGAELDVEIAGASGESVSLELRDMQGQVVSQKQVVGGETAERHRLSVAGQPAGLLLLRVSTPTQVKVIKVIKAE